ncbi:hypothetical protein D0Y65_018743 [Glycine soja]|uniref:Uncharacterized protein n=1 Tax=Glycine soja TaxID=3848 RepID=A0A445K0I1_GLYSO|nr:hypothetical protein D0Y65_018743 [Glycine soja]
MSRRSGSKQQPDSRCPTPPSVAPSPAGRGRGRGRGHGESSSIPTPSPVNAPSTPPPASTIDVPCGTAPLRVVSPSLAAESESFTSAVEMQPSPLSSRKAVRFSERPGCGEGEGALRWSAAANKVFECREDVLRWARSVAHENGFVSVILRSDTNTVVGGEDWMMKLICGVHNHELAKSLVGHPYAGRLTKAKKTLIADMTKSMVKPRNILLTLKEHNANTCRTIKQIYNARSAFRSSIRGSDLEMQHLMKLLERDQYIHWHIIKDEDVVRDIFWCHPDAVKLFNTCNLVFLIDNTYKTNRYRLPLLDVVGVTDVSLFSPIS